MSNATECYYLDTSALLPYYREEAVSAQVQTFLMELNYPVVISSLTEVEFASALARWVRLGELNERQAGLVESAFAEDCEVGRYQMIPLETRNFRRARDWLLRRQAPLRSLDALHLSCAYSMSDALVTCDEALARAGEDFGINVRLLREVR